MLTKNKRMLKRFFKNKKYLIINILGLSLSMGAALIILLFLRFELSYDTFHPDHKNLYRVATHSVISGEDKFMALNSVALGPGLKSEFEKITDFTRLFAVSFFFRNLLYESHRVKDYEKDVFAADPGFFRMFSFPLEKGNPETALHDPFSLVLTQGMADKYFGEQTALGQKMTIGDAGEFTITGIIEDPPVNTHFRFGALISLSTLAHLDHLFERTFGSHDTWQNLEHDFGNRIMWVYIKTKPSFDPEKFVQDQWPAFWRNVAAPASHSSLQSDMPILQPVNTIYQQSRLFGEITLETGARKQMNPDLIHAFFILALFLLAGAITNYVNISVIRFNSRKKEIGIKKLLGVPPWSQIKQFWAEAFGVVLLAFALALFFTELSIPLVNQLLTVNVGVSQLFHPVNLAMVLLCMAVITLLAGVYPALYLLSIPTHILLRQNFTTGNHQTRVKKGFLIFQFCISVFLLISTFVNYKQLLYTQNKDLGFNPKNTLLIELPGEEQMVNSDWLMQQLTMLPMVESTTQSNYYPPLIPIFNFLDINLGDHPRTLSVNTVQVGMNFPELLEMRLKKGRFFDEKMPGDLYHTVLINEAALEYFEWDWGVGKILDAHFHLPSGDYAGHREVIGVIEDFHYSSLLKEIEPMALFPMRGKASFILVKIKPGNRCQALESINETWKSFAPQTPFQYHFIDEAIDMYYDSPRRLSAFFSIFSFLSILISFLGIYGISAYTAELRTREIGIRLVHGARFYSVMGLIGKQYFPGIMAAIITASALGWYAMHVWLQTFTYHAPLKIWPFVMAALMTFGIALMAFAINTYGILRQNPVQSLRDE